MTTHPPTPQATGVDVEEFVAHLSLLAQRLPSLQQQAKPQAQSQGQEGALVVAEAAQHLRWVGGGGVLGFGLGAGSDCVYISPPPSQARLDLESVGRFAFSYSYKQPNHIIPCTPPLACPLESTI